MKIYLFSFVLILIFLHNLSARDFYVSPSGSDSNSGSSGKPFLSIEKARDAVRKVNQTMTADIVVNIEKGSYPISENIEFGPEDSGQNGHKVIYSASKGETTILKGSRRITKWEFFDKDRNIYVAKTDSGLFRQLYVDGKPAIRAREPNLKSQVDSSPFWPSLVKEIPKLLINKEYWQVCKNIPQEKLAEIEIVMICHWYHQRIRIGSVTDNGKEIEVTPLQPKGKFNKVLRFYQNNMGMKNPFYFENALQFLDQPYEWYYDPEKFSLYLCLPQKINPQELNIEIPTIETLIKIQGTSEKPVMDIEFRGLTFEGSNWTDPSNHGVNMTQAAQVVGGKQPPGIFEAQHSRNLGIRNCVFRNTGGHAIHLLNAGSTDIEGNRFYNIAANAIDIDKNSGRNPKPEKQSVDVAVWNNHAKRCGNHYRNGVFLLAGNVKGLIVEHNLIHDMPYSGMQIGQQPGKMQDVGCGNNRIRFNHIHHCNQVHGDGGGIYTLGGIQKGSIIAGNYVHDIIQSKWDHYKIDNIYLDNFTSEILVQDNVVSGGRAGERNGSKGNKLVNNLQSNPEVENNAGIKAGYHPRNSPE